MSAESESRPYPAIVERAAPKAPGAPNTLNAIATKYGKVLHVWFVQYCGSEFGPLREDELAVVLRSGKLKGPIYAWRKGLPDWVSISESAELTRLVLGDQTVESVT